MKWRFVMLFGAYLAVAVARPVTPVPIDAAASKADLVVIGSLRQGSQAGARISGIIDVVRVLKGTSSPGQGVPVQWEGTGQITSSHLLPAVDGLWFLKGSGTYTIIPKIEEADDINDLYYPVSSVTPAPTFKPTGTEALIDKVVLEIAAAVSSTEPRPNGTLVYALTRANASPTVYRRLMRSDAPNVQAAACAALISAQDVAALQDCEPRMSELASTRASVFLANSLEEMRSPDVAVVAALGRIATSASTPQFSKYAARSIAAIHTRASLPFLARMLDSPDLQIRTAAVNGLSAFVKNLPVRTPENLANLAWMRPLTPSAELTEDVESHLEIGELLPSRDLQVVDFWRAWWKQNRARLEVQP